MKGYRLLGNERGSVLFFMLGTLLGLLVFGGLAIDLSFLSTARGELQRSMDAAALAGAGNLGFDDSVFPTVRQRAWDFANLNPTRANLSTLNPTGAINLDQNPGNDPTKDIVLGVWDGTSFTVDSPLDASTVNAVKCQYATNVPTSFLGILGINILPVSAQAIAVANPAANPGPGCVAPIGLSDCAFTDGGGGYDSGGCGVPISFISSSGNLQPGTEPPGTNTAAWMNFLPPLPECDPEVETCCDPPEVVENCVEDFGWKDHLVEEINNMADNTCEASTASYGQPTAVNNGLLQPVVNALETAFMDNFNDPNYDPMNPITATNADGDVVYSGRGWELTAAVIKKPPPEEESVCPAGAISGEHVIVGWTKFVMTQVINKGKCAAPNITEGSAWDPLCPPPNGTGTSETMPNNANAFRAVFGYYDCELIQSPPTPGPAPRSSLATGRKLVQ